MRLAIKLGLASASSLLAGSLLAGGFATSVADYQPGAGYVTDWATGAGYTDAPAALGAPSRQTVDPDPQFGGTFAVDPFSPPYLRSQIVSIGQGGLLTLQFDSLVVNDPVHAYGVDFIVFGSAGFVIVNGDYTGGGITDGSLFGNQSSGTQVAVSADGVNFFELNPSLAPVFDSYLPTDGSGDFFKAADPALAAASFNGKDLAGIRQLYAGSAGGTGYDLAWARDAQGNPANLDAAKFIRFSVNSGHAEIDAVVAVPEPGVGALLALGAAAMLVSRQRRQS
jgi:hypothetical protein